MAMAAPQPGGGPGRAAPQPAWLSASLRLAARRGCRPAWQSDFFFSALVFLLNVMKNFFDSMLNGLYELGACPVIMLDAQGRALFKRLPAGTEYEQAVHSQLFNDTLAMVRSRSDPVRLTREQPSGGYLLPDLSAVIVGPLPDERNQQTAALRRSAVNTQLDSLAFAARRLIAALTPLESRPGEDIFSELDPVRHVMPRWEDVVPDDRPHSSYLFELRALDAVTVGDPEAYMKVQNSSRNGQNGTLGYTALRASQNLAICGLVLNSRAAIAGGLSVEQAYTIADWLILGIENCRTPEEADFIGLKSGVIFARMVRELKEAAGKSHMDNPLTVRALEAVRRHVYSSTDRLELAAELGVNADYLDRVLSRSLNMSVTGCLRNERIKEAQRLLVQTEIPVYEIAQMLLFSSSSHFARIFREVTGTTPASYRRRRTAITTPASL